ncbi:MAG TPA: general stress protein [Gemmatimonadales bacterium]
MAHDNDRLDLDHAGRIDSPVSRNRVFGMFSDSDDAVRAIRALQSAGFGADRIGIAMQDRDVQARLVEETGSGAADGAKAGAVSGGVVGGLVGLLGSLVIPGLGPIVVGGILASTLTGAGVGALTGGLIGALIGAGASQEEAEHFDAGFRSGGTLVTVDAEGRESDARRILRSAGADLGPSWALENEAGIIPTEADFAQVGEERRRWSDPAYEGPERRLLGV